MTMYLEHFGLTEAPFKITPHTEFFFGGAHRGETLEALIYAITSGEGMVKVTGEVGAGKTMLCRVLMERLPKTVETIYLAVPALSRDEMLAVVADDLGIDTQGGNTTKLVRALQEKLIQIHESGRQVVALIDEAHAMPLETLEQIRLLSNLETSHDKLMQIVLFGQPELDSHLVLPHMRQLKERITHSFVLLPLPATDIKDYLDFRLRAAGYKGPDLFGAEAIKVIAEASEGLTRRINIYADKTLLAAFAGNTHNITADHVRAAVSDTQIVLPQTRRKHARTWAAVAISLLIGAGLGFAAGRITGRSSAPHLAASAPSTAKAAVSAAAPAVVSNPTPPAPAVNPVPPETAPTLQTPQTLTSTPTAPPLTPAVPAAPIAGLEQRYATDLAKLRSFKPSAWTVQLMTADARDTSAIERFLRDAAGELGTTTADKLIVFPAGTTALPRASIVLAPYENRADANNEMARLPKQVAQFKPYARAVQMVAVEARTSTNTGTNTSNSRLANPNPSIVAQKN
jgi:MSHA biogenesis protein MshM